MGQWANCPNILCVDEFARAPICDSETVVGTPLDEKADALKQMHADCALLKRMGRQTRIHRQQQHVFVAPVRDRKNKTRRKIISDISKTISFGEKKKVPRDAPRDKNNNFAIIFFKPF